MKRSDFLIKLVSALVFAALVVYLVFSTLGRDQTLYTVEAVSEEIRESVATEGCVVRLETPVRARGDGVALIVRDGEKVSFDETVAIRFTSAEAVSRSARLKELQLRMDQLTQLQNGATQEKLAEESVMKLAACVTRGYWRDLFSAAQAVDTWVLTAGTLTGHEESEIAAIEAEIAELSAESAADTIHIRAETPGLFSYSYDGYEGVTPDKLYDIRPSGVAGLLRHREDSDGVIGKLVTGIYWYYVTTLPEADAARLKEGRTANIEFTRTYSKNLTMNVESVSPTEGGRCAVVFSSARFMGDIAGLRELTGEIVFSSRTGIRVPKEALHVDDDGRAFVYILEGLRAKKVVVDITEARSDYYVVETKDGSLRVRDQIIVRAEELYDGAVVAE